MLEIREVGYDHPDAELLIAEVQAEYVVRYGGPDDSPVQPAAVRRRPMGCSRSATATSCRW